MKNDLDMELYEKYLKGEKEAFELLYSKYKNKIQYFIFNIVKDYQKAEDITQEVYIYILQNKMKENYTFKYYIYLVAKSRALSYINCEKRRGEIGNKYLLFENQEVEKDVLELITKEEDKKELMEAINLLDEKYRNAIYLVKIEELSYKETAKILGKSVPNVKNFIHRGKKELRKILIQKGSIEVHKVSKIGIILICAGIFLSGITYAGVKVYNEYIQKQESIHTRGLFENGEGRTTFKDDLMQNDMTWNHDTRLYHRVITNEEEYFIYKNRISQLPDVNFSENFIVIIANENTRDISEIDLIISSVISDETAMHIVMEQKENPDYFCENNVWFAVVENSQLRENVDITIEIPKIYNEEWTEIEKISGDYSVSQAIKDGCVVVEFKNSKNKVISKNPNAIDEFLEKSQKGEDSFIRIYYKPEFELEIEIRDVNFRNGLYYLDTRRINDTQVRHSNFKYLEKNDEKDWIRYYFTNGEELIKRNGLQKNTKSLISIDKY